MPHVCRFVNNPALGDPRVTRQAEACVAAGMRQTVIAPQDHREQAPLRTEQRGVLFLRPAVPSSLFGRLAGRSKGATANNSRAAGEGEMTAGSSSANGHEAIGGGHFMKSAIDRLWTLRRELLSGLQRLRLGLMCDADAYYAHNCDTLWMGYFCSLVRRRPLVYDSHELWVDWLAMGNSPRWQVGWARLTERFIVRRCRLVVTVSDELAEILCRRYGIQRAMVINNCPHRPEPPAAALRAEARRTLGIDEQEPVVVYQGGLWPNRGLDNLVRSAARLPQVKYYLIGKPNEYGENLRRLARENGCENVVFTGHRDEAERNRYMAASDLGVVLTQDRSLSYRNTISNKIFEYWSNGLPVLASDLPPHRRLEAETPACVLCNPDSGESVGGAIGSFFALPPESRRNMGECGLRAVMQQYNIEAQMTPMLEFLRAIDVRQSPGADVPSGVAT